MLEYEDVTDVEEFSDEEGIEVSKSAVAVARARGDEPPSKRPKSETIIEPQVSNDGKVGISLASISPDILARICGYCSPSDLVNIARVSKGLRMILVSQKFVSVWKTARVSTSGIPNCPSYMSELRWAHLLFGRFCQCCGEKRTRRIDFHLLRRVCAECLMENSLFSDCDGFDEPDGPRIQELLLTCSPSPDFEFYWGPDVNAISKQLKSLNDDVKAGKPHAQRLLDEFVAKRRREVQLIEKDAVKHKIWADKQEKRRKSSLAKLTKARLMQIEKRLVDMGWSKSDICAIRTAPEASKSVLLSDGAWSRVLPKLEAHLAEDKRRKLEEARVKQVEARTKIFIEGYHKFKDTVHPTQHVLLPSDSQASYLKEFRHLIDADIDVDITANSFARLFEDQPGIVASWASVRETAILDLLPENLRRSYVDEGLVSPTIATNLSSPLSPRMDLAIHAFTCAVVTIC
ncbi:hypothetical protein JAAARDRAFT_210696 [Jaapia argillacea MUCL 33604]|uniref:F-box domain-containing protein n=1 Tax=Jaapia argillacea MUCL 33604 TaxID=933084 RepID=A0A067PAX8_9AGAM|nr:hypothetical protein JAAARDRAFT_210696 [Jaapia argillacea MUCL 33604]